MFARQPKFVLTLLAAYVLTLSIASAQISKKSARKRAVKQEEAAPAPQPPPPPPPAHTGADAGFGAAGILSQWSVDYRCPELDLGRYLARSAHANRGFGGRALKRDRARGQQSRPRPGARRARLSTEWIAFQLCDARFAE